MNDLLKLFLAFKFCQGFFKLGQGIGKGINRYGRK